MEEIIVTDCFEEMLLVDKGSVEYGGDFIGLTYYPTHQRIAVEVRRCGRDMNETFLYHIRTATDFAYVIAKHDIKYTDTSRRFFNVCMNKFLDPLQDMEIAW